jgi:hypothetical protein
MILLLAVLSAGASVVFLSWLLARSHGQTLIFKDRNFQIQIPDDWSVRANPKYVVEAQRRAGASIRIKAERGLASDCLNHDRFSEGMKKRSAERGFDFLCESRDPFHRYVAYACTRRKEIRGHQVYIHTIRFKAGDFRYSLMTTKVNADPTLDPQLQMVVNSFTLLAQFPN